MHELRTVSWVGLSLDMYFALFRWSEVPLPRYGDSRAFTTGPKPSSPQTVCFDWRPSRSMWSLRYWAEWKSKQNVTGCESIVGHHNIKKTNELLSSKRFLPFLQIQFDFPQTSNGHCLWYVHVNVMQTARSPSNPRSPVTQLRSPVTVELNSSTKSANISIFSAHQLKNRPACPSYFLPTNSRN